MRWIVLLSFCLLGSACTQIDNVISNHPLLNQSVQAPDYVLAVENLPLTYSGSKVLHNVNAHLFGIDEALRLGYSPDNRDLSVKEVFSPGQLALVVKEVHFTQPGFPSSLFDKGSYFAILEDEKKNRYTVTLISGAPILRLNNCEDDRKCANLRVHLETILKTKKKNLIFVDYLPFDENKISTEESNKKFAEFLTSKSIRVLEDLKYRPSLVVEVDYLQYGNLILYSPIFNIQNVSPYSVMK